MNRLLRSIMCSLPDSDVKAQVDNKYYQDLRLAIRGAVSLSAFSIRTSAVILIQLSIQENLSDVGEFFVC